MQLQEWAWQSNTRVLIDRLLLLLNPGHLETQNIGGAWQKARDEIKLQLQSKSNIRKTATIISYKHYYHKGNN